MYDWQEWAQILIPKTTKEEKGKYESTLPEILQLVMQSEKVREILAVVQKEV
ncbi:hypothetical protein RE474_06815 [Methanolobus sediminis]|uniref:Uncharacterized protein n=1 Tax=Methanolobus sediminis TaxID=3072978 RepID=A0AA51UIM8_9EURY|nr:hypothetical protein [Methanolobus sediminis]WMW23823.1 hypothetical protein RE474_06815 [Methanolobus sediminis]